MDMLLRLCAKELHFSSQGDMYKQVDVVIMGSALGPIIANIFMVEFENEVIPKIPTLIPKWERYVDDTLAFIEEEQIDNVLNILNEYHADIKFTYEVEKNNELPFLDVLVNRTNENKILLDVYRKKTCSDIYIHWKSFAPKIWKIGTLEGLIRRAHLICSCENNRKKELSYLRKIFKDVNGYPESVIDECLKNVKRKLESQHESPATESIDTPGKSAENVLPEKRPYITLPYAGNRGDKIVKNLKRHLHKCLPKNVKPLFVYQGTTIGSFFPLKDRLETQHCSNLIYYYINPSDPTDDYGGETKCRLGKRIKDHQGTDKYSTIYRHNMNKDLPPAKPDDFQIIERNYPHNTKRKIAESLFIKRKKPSLNKQADSYKLKLFN